MAHRVAAARRAGRARAARGFTMLETMLTLMIVTVGVASVFDAYSSFTTTNTWSTQAATGTFLASEIRELTRGLPRHDPVTGLEIDTNGALSGWGIEPGELGALDFDDLDDFDGVVFAFDGAPLDPLLVPVGGPRLPGPIDGAGDPITDFALVGVDTDGNATPFGWVQVVEVEKVRPFDYTTAVTDATRVLPGLGVPGREVDEYPIRVTVTVLYRDRRANQAQRIAEVSWVVP